VTPHLVIDVRKAFDSGIGTYVRHVVPRVCARLRGVRISLLIPPASARLHREYLADLEIELVEVAARAFGLREQLELRQVVPADSVFWATSLAHPLFTRRPLITMVHDVAQLVLGREGGVGPATRVAGRVFFRSIRERSGLILTNSEFSRNELLRTVGAPRRASVTVTPLGVDDGWFSLEAMHSTPAAPPYFVSVGNVRPHKNIRRLLEAFSQVKERLPHDLVIIGQSEGFRTADPRALELLRTLGGRARFLGHVSDSELKRVVAGADAMVLPSLYEGFGLPALEAMASGCPVLASRAGALPEVCGDAARLFDPYAPEAIADALLAHAHLSQAARDELVARGRLHARGYSWERTAELSAHAIGHYLDAALSTPVESYPS
jgi:glycosyltransferase involved in cell wall biosynthesis